jgi:hypothetical protein
MTRTPPMEMAARPPAPSNLATLALEQLPSVPPPVVTMSRPPPKRKLILCKILPPPDVTMATQRVGMVVLPFVRLNSVTLVLEAPQCASPPVVMARRPPPKRKFRILQQFSYVQVRRFRHNEWGWLFFHLHRRIRMDLYW